MTDVMTARRGRTWWTAGVLAFLSALLTLTLLHAAGIGSPDNWAQWLVHFLCFGTIWRVLGFLGWLALVLIAPKSKLLDPAKR